TEIEDSNLVDDQHSSGNASPVMTDSEIEDTNLANQQTWGAYSNNVQDADVENSMNHVLNEGDASSSLWDSNGNDIADQDSSGDLSPNVQDVDDIENSFFQQNADGDVALNTQNSDFEENLLINGDLNNDGVVNVNAPGAGYVSVGNVATDDATIFDGDL